MEHVKTIENIKSINHIVIAENELSQICDINDFIKSYPYLHMSRKRFRYLLRHKAENGLAELNCLYRLGSGYGVHRQKFKVWYLAYMRAHILD